MRGERGQCLCTQVEILISVRTRIEEQVQPEAFPLRGYELADLARQAVMVDKLCEDAETEASNLPEALDYALLSIEELNELNELLERAETYPAVTRPRRPEQACPHAELVALVRDRVEEMITSPGMPLEGYELSRLVTQARALNAILLEFEDRTNVDDLAGLPANDFDRVQVLMAKARQR